jgi:hypothetical protein
MARKKKCPQGCVPATAQPQKTATQRSSIAERAKGSAARQTYVMNARGMAQPVDVALSDAPFSFEYTQAESVGKNKGVCGGKYLPGRLKAGRCGIQLTFKDGKGYLRLCDAPNKLGKLIEVNSPDEANRVAAAACAEWGKSRRYTKVLAANKSKIRKGLGGASSDCPNGKITRGPKKGQCRVAPVRSSGSKARKAR